MQQLQSISKIKLFAIIFFLLFFPFTQYLELRFSSTVRTIASVMFVIDEVSVIDLFMPKKILFGLADGVATQKFNNRCLAV